MKKEKMIVVTIMFFIIGLFVWVKFLAPTEENVIQAAHGPSLNTLDQEANAEDIKQGRDYINHTSSLLPDHVGSTMSCASCHATGATGGSLDLVGVTKEYPQYNKRAGKDVSIEERVNGCFTRSMNGTKLDLDGKEMKAIVAYLDFLAKDTPDGIKERPWTKIALEGDLPKPNIGNGKDIYSNSCMACHGSTQADGHGLAVFGKNSYNDGAGMNRLRTTAGFIQNYMPKEPMGGVETGGLTRQEAVDVAAYINSVGRPVMKGKEKDYPNGDPPDDLSYPIDSVSKQ
ncbi:c-type cytochrome [Exiguobacterium oxidotolerans]|uniref:c-type cytochrome n=1 Tax=Exiguobacterium oxidotolerans TaxID=223958 RepID=UPI00068B4E4E|nr:c-type cytochrome [Exiguobacterium oxidotolerans]